MKFAKKIEGEDKDESDFLDVEQLIELIEREYYPSRNSLHNYA